MRTLLCLIRLLLLVTITDADYITISDGPSVAGIPSATRTVAVTASSGSVSTTTASTVDDYTPGPL